MDGDKDKDTDKDADKRDRDSDSSSFEDLAEAIKEHEDLEHLHQEEEWTDVLGSGHIMKKIINKGDNDMRPRRNDICKISLEGRLQTTKKVVESEEELEIQSGCGDVIQAIDLVVPLMYEGETCELRITPRFGYGSFGNPPDIPPDADLEYTLSLLSFNPEPELDTMSIEQRKQIGIKKRERGNWWYNKMQDPTLAIQCYKKAIEYLDEVDGGITDPTVDGNMPEISTEVRELYNERIKAYNNLAAAQIKLESYDTALTSVEHVLKCQPFNVKALFRKGKILAYKNEPEEAAKVFREALSISPDDMTIKKELMAMEMKIAESKRKEKELAQKMFAGALSKEDAKEKDDKPKKSSKKKIFFWGTLLFSIAMGALSIAIYRYKLM